MKLTNFCSLSRKRSVNQAGWGFEFVRARSIKGRGLIGLFGLVGGGWEWPLRGLMRRRPALAVRCHGVVPICRVLWA